MKVKALMEKHEALLSRPNLPEAEGNGIYTRYQHPVVTAAHTPIIWRYDLNEATNPYLMERIGMNATMNAGAIKWNGKYLLVVRVEGADRKSFFAVAESPNGIDNFRFWDYPITMPDDVIPATNIYDMRLTVHEDGWIYGIFCAERHDPNAAPGDLSSATATAAIARTKDLKTWERLPDLKSKSQQRNVVLHPEFVNGKYALYTRPQDGFIDAGSGGGIGWALIDDITHAEVKEETIIDSRYYHTIKEVKNGEGPHPIKTPQGWLHLAHGVRGCAAGLRYVLYMYMTSLEDPAKLIASPAGYFMAPEGEERIGIGAQFTNVGRAEIYGVDLSTTGTWTFNKQSKLNYMLGHVYTNPIDMDHVAREAEEEANTDLLAQRSKSNDSKYLKYRQKHSVKAVLDWEWRRFNIGTNLSWKSKTLAADWFIVDEREKAQPDVMDYLRQLLYGDVTGDWMANNKGYFVMDLRAGVRLNRYLHLQALINNVLNKRYCTRPMDVAAPRTFMVQLSADF